MDKMNTVEQLLVKSFIGLSYEDRLQVKRLGPHQPDLILEQSSKDKGKEYVRRFTTSWYEKKKWLCGSASRKSLFCFPCLLFGGEVAWSQLGINDLKHLSEKIKKHESCKSHLDNAVKLAMLGNKSIATQLDESYRVGIRKHNEEVERNRYTLSKLIDCIRFCGVFELAVRGHDEIESSLNSGVFGGLVDFVSSIDRVMEKHVKSATVFKGTSKTVQNELLDCMLDVAREFIVKQLRSTEYVAIHVGDTTDVSTKCQSALVYRYIDGNGKVVERFFGFTHLQNLSAESFATNLLEQLDFVFPENNDKQKLISQSYDGANVLRGETGSVQRKVKDIYPNAHYVHSYAHQLCLFMEQAVSRISQVRIFFCDLSGFPAFFSRFPKRTEVLDAIVSRRLPRGTATRWINVRTVNIVYEHREDLLECFKTIESSREFESNSVREARAFIRILQDREFVYFLSLFHEIMPHVVELYSQLQKRDIDTVFVEKITAEFVKNINKVRECIEELGSKLSADSEFPQCPVVLKKLEQVAKKVCDIIIVNAKERFAFTKHLVSAKLLQSDLFEKHNQGFPMQALNDTVQTYPMLNRERLRTELCIIYEKPEFRCASGAMALFRFFIENDLQDTFSETVTLLRILITTPMTTTDPERCFSTLKKIKTLLRNTMNQDRLSALAMLSIEKQLVHEIPDFNKKTIEKFAAQKDRQAKFMYK
ncbi:zinc finger MYM-type protein 1-like [Homarus americanus]|uniref:zinc finger MYM-type protein 1-like n=1 Tax=Homarus americanus TaxID=6706 RepID=UPI001C43C396|nr:zinc finger MYM-type protein 1-like [Homarus americanus]